MLRWIVPLFLAATPAFASSPGLSVGSWWEKITVTMTSDGKAQACTYETSLTSAAGQDCKVVGANGVAVQASSGKGQYATITFERRFSTRAALEDGAMQPGDKLLGRQVLALAIDGAGKVSGCEVIMATGETGLSYGCNEASAERFEAAASSAPRRRGFMTILVYGHTEHVV